MSTFCRPSTAKGDLFICDVADAALKDLIPQMEHPFYSLSKKPDTDDSALRA